MDVGVLSDAQLDNLIANHESKKSLDSPVYRAALEERAKRRSKSLNIEVSLRHLTDAARDRRFTTYGDLAHANSVPWKQARPRMNGPRGHLDLLLDVCHARKIPLLTSICVNQPGLATGALEPSALQGFVNGARRVGYDVVDGRKFLGECQQECFAWASDR